MMSDDGRRFDVVASRGGTSDARDGEPRRAGGAPFARRAARGAITGAPRRLAEAWR